MKFVCAQKAVRRRSGPTHTRGKLEVGVDPEIVISSDQIGRGRSPMGIAQKVAQLELALARLPIDRNIEARVGARLPLGTGAITDQRPKIVVAQGHVSAQVAKVSGGGIYRIRWRLILILHAKD